MLAQALFLKSYALNAGRNTGMEIRKFLEKTRGIIIRGNPEITN
jgi:hypothetical protein